MKKIVGAVLTGALLAGAASAADISFSYAGNNYFSAKSGNFNYLGTSRADCLSVGLSNEQAGVVVDFDVDGTSLVQDQYYAWLNFGLPVGNLQLTAGNWSSSYSDDVTTDAGDLDGEDFILWDMGVLNPNGSVGMNSDNLTYDAANDKNVLSTVAAWTVDDLLPGKLMVKGGIVTVSEWDSFKKMANRKTAWNSGFVGEVSFIQENVINIDFAFKNFVKKNASFALFVSPLMIENLEATAGLTLATELPENKLYDRVYDFAFDLRARYKLTEAMSVTTAHNFTYYTSYDSTATTEANAYDDSFLAMANQIALAYKFADNLTAKFNYQQYMKQAFEYHDGCFVDQIFFTPSVEIAATEKATVTVASRFGWEGVGHEGNETFGVVIPVIFSYNY